MAYTRPTSSSDGSDTPSYQPPRQSGGRRFPGNRQANYGPTGTRGPTIADNAAERYRYQDSGFQVGTNKATDPAMGGWGNTVKPIYGGPRYPRNRSGGNRPAMNPAWKQLNSGFNGVGQNQFQNYSLMFDGAGRLPSRPVYDNPPPAFHDGAFVQGTPAGPTGPGGNPLPNSNIRGWGGNDPNAAAMGYRPNYGANAPQPPYGAITQGPPLQSPYNSGGK